MIRKFFCTLLAAAAMCVALAGTAAAEETETAVEEAAAVADETVAGNDEAAADTEETAAQETGAGETGAQLYYVTDEAGILTEEEDLALEQRAETVSLEYGVGVYIVTLDDYKKYDSGDVFETTYDIYHDYTMGEGEDRDGIMLLLSMADRDWAMFCYGENSEYAFNDYGQEQLEKVFLDNFGNNDWYGGFTDYIDNCEIYLQKAADGAPVRASAAVPILIMSAVVLFITFLIVGNMWVRMNNVAKQTKANAYAAGNLVLTGKTEKFLYKSEARRRLQSSSSGGSSKRSGGGGSGRSGKF